MSKISTVINIFFLYFLAFSIFWNHVSHGPGLYLQGDLKATA